MKKALIIIDVQQGMFEAANPVHQGDLLIENIRKLIFKARAADVPIVYIQHNASAGKPLEPGKPGWAIHLSIQPEIHDLVIQKTTPDAFYKTTLHDILANLSVSELILAGIQTEVCVDTTCRRAYSLGYKVTLVSDGHSTWDSHTLVADQIVKHHNNVLKWFAEVKDNETLLF